MSEDQRPLRVRVVNNGMASTRSRQRRRNDPAVLAAAAAAAAAIRPRGRSISLTGAILFLAGCGAGGAIATAAGLFRVLGL